MSVVADVLATLRADSSNFVGEVNHATESAEHFGEEVLGTGERLAKLNEMAGIVATGIGATFTVALVKGLEIARSYNSEIEQLQVSFGALLGGKGQANNQISEIQHFAANMGLATSSVATMSKELEILTQGQHDTVGEWKVFSDEAAALGRDVGGVAESFGRAYQLMQRSGSQGGSFATRSLLMQGLIDPNTANSVKSLAQQGASPDEIWDKLIAGAQKYNGAAKEAAGTMAGLSASFHDLISESVGGVFQPLIAGSERLLAALNNLMKSEGFRSLVERLSNDIDNLSGRFGGLVGHINNLNSSLNGDGIGNFLDHLKSIEGELGLVMGLVAEFGAEFVGELPIISRFSEPFMSFLEHGRGGLLGMLLATKDSRDALIDFGGAVFNFGKALTNSAGPIDELITLVTKFMGYLIEGAAAIINLIAQSHGLVSAIELIVAAFAGLVIIDKITNTLGALYVGLGKSIESFEKWRTGILSTNTAKENDIEVTNGEVVANERLVGVLTQLRDILLQVTQAQTALNTEMSVEAERAAIDTAAIEEKTVAEEATAKAGLLGGISKGTMLLGGGMLLGAGAMMAGSAIGGKPGQVLGDAGAGAMIGGAAASITGVGIPIGMGIGALAGGLYGLFAGGKSSGPSPHDIGYQNAVSNLAATAPVGEHDYNSVTKTADQARMQLADANDRLNQLRTTSFGGTSSGESQRNKDIKEQEGAVQALQAAFSKASDSAMNFNNNIAKVQAANPAVSIQDVADKAKEMGLSLDQGGRVGADAVERLTATMKDSRPALNQLQQQVDSFTEAQTHLNEVVIQGNELQKKKLELQITDIQQAEDQTKFAYTLAQANYQNDQAVRGLTAANSAYAVAQSNQLDGAQAVTRALAQQTSVLPNLNQLVAQMSQSYEGTNDGMAKFIPMITDATAKLQPMKDQLDALNRTYQLQQNDLTVLTDKLKNYQTQLDRPLAGTKAADEAAHANEMAQKAIDVQIQTLMAAGHFSAEPMVQTLQHQLDILRTQGQVMADNRELTLGDQAFQLQQAAKPDNEISFQAAKDAAGNVKDLSTQVNNLNITMGNEKPQIDELNGAYTVSKAKLDLLVGAFSTATTANNGLLGAWNSQQGAVHSLNDSLEQLRSLSVESSIKAIQQTQNVIDRATTLAQIANDQLKKNQVDATDAILGVTRHAGDSLATLAAKQAAIMTDINSMANLTTALSTPSLVLKYGSDQINHLMQAVNTNLADLSAGRTSSPVAISVDIHDNSITSSDDLHDIVRDAVSSGFDQLSNQLSYGRPS